MFQDGRPLRGRSSFILLSFIVIVDFMARIHILEPGTARLIAAGEVIDRPASALRELIDNAIDAGATEIHVELEKGGIELLRLRDNGSGMSREDLELSILEHATSKIRDADDLLLATTLGFRGEALASMAAVARIEITTKEAEGSSAWKLSKEPGRDAIIEAVAARNGTTILLKGLFDRFPARKQFLKRPASETGFCRQVFVERAAAWPGIAFSWKSQSEAEHLPATDRKARIALLYRELAPALLSQIDFVADGCPVSIVYADPSYSRRDRKLLQIFINGRKVPEWGLSGVLEYAFAEYLPGGTKPCAFLFAQVDPARADFNIHPAKKEVRLRQPEALRSAIYSQFKTHLNEKLGAGPTDMSGARIIPPVEFWERVEKERKDPVGTWTWEQAAAYPVQRPAAQGPGGARADLSAQEAVQPASKNHEEDFRYLGRAFGPFIVFERAGGLFIMDQHAAHERILFDRLKSHGAPGQALLVPYVHDDLDEGMRARLEANLPELKRMGYEFHIEQGRLILEAVPAFLRESGIAAFVEGLEGLGSPDLPMDEFLAGMACKAAVKDGEILDELSARRLIAEALALPFPRCPHGRPIWVRLDEATLARMVGRTLG